MVISFSMLFLLLLLFTTAWSYHKKPGVSIFRALCSQLYSNCDTKKKKKKKTRAETLENNTVKREGQKKNNLEMQCHKMQEIGHNTQRLLGAGFYTRLMLRKHYCAATRSSPIGYIYAHSVCSFFSQISRLEKIKQGLLHACRIKYNLSRRWARRAKGDG